MEVNHQLFQLQFSPGFFPPDLRWRRRLHGSPRPHQCHLHQGQASPVGAESLEHWENGPVEDVTAENKEFQLLKLTKWYKVYIYIHMDHDIVYCAIHLESVTRCELAKEIRFAGHPMFPKMMETRWKTVSNCTITKLF